MEQRLAMLRALLDNPASNPTAAAVAIAVVVLGLLVVVALLLAWAAPSGPPSVVPAAGRVRRPRSGGGSRARGWTLLAMLLALAAAAATYGVTSQNSFCGTVCHAMASPDRTWRGSSHAKVPCVTCHEGQLVLSAPWALLSRTRSIAAELSSAGPVWASSVPASRCMGCHASIARGVVVSASGVAMAHSQVIAAGASCDDCHGRQGHEKTGRVPPMSSCLRCHDGDHASATCAECHRKPASSLITPTDIRFGKVTLPEDPTCEGCHPQTTCDACHGLRMPHPAGYAEARAHARPAAFGAKESLCYRCHVFADCAECHMAFDAHGPGWQQKHRLYPRDALWCTECHDTRDMCSVCHPSN